MIGFLVARVRRRQVVMELTNDQEPQGERRRIKRLICTSIGWQTIRALSLVTNLVVTKQAAVFCLIGLVLCTAIGGQAYATSACYQWRAAVNTYSDTVWSTNPQIALDHLKAFCTGSDATLATCGFNSTNYSWRNWSISSSPTAWPTVLGRIVWHYQYKSKMGGFPTDWTDSSNENASVSPRTNPAGCHVYVSASPPAAAQCGHTCNSVGDPVDPASGAMYSSEADLGASGTLEFKRFYGSAGTGTSPLSVGWRHSFSRSVKPVYSSSTYRTYVTSPDNSSKYTDEAQACTSGFAQIKSRVGTWASATASYSNGVCTLSAGGTSIGRLPIYYTSPPTPAPGSTVLIGYDAIRDNGQLVSFMIDGGAIVAPLSITLRLQQTGSGYTLTDANNATEAYDANGKLQSITSRAGVVQTMSYDTSGRLSTVADSFGHTLTLTYDSQNRLSTVTSQ